MSRQRTDTLESYESLPLDSPERRMIQNRNAQRIYRAKKVSGANTGTFRPGQAPVSTQPINVGSTSIPINSGPPPSISPLPEPQDRSHEGNSSHHSFGPSQHSDLGDDDLLTRMLAGDASYSLVGASSTEVSRAVISTSLGGGGFVDTSTPFGPVFPEKESSGPSQKSSRSATADITSSWDDGDFRADLGLPSRLGAVAPPIAHVYTSMEATTLNGASDAAAAPQTPVLPSGIPPRTLSHLPILPITPHSTSSLQTYHPMSKEGAFLEDDLRSGCVWRCPTHTATLLRLQVAEAKNELLESQIETEREKVVRYQEQARHAQQMQQIGNRAGRRREHSSDHYSSESRKRLIRPRTPKEQSVTNIESLLSWIRDCEDYIDAAICDFDTDVDMITWSASLLAQKRKDQWRTHADELHRQGIDITWRTYCDYLVALLDAPRSRNQVAEFEAERSKHPSHDRRDRQTSKIWTHGNSSLRESHGVLRGRGQDPEGDPGGNMSDDTRSSVSDFQKGDFVSASSPRHIRSRRRHVTTEGKAPVRYGYRGYGCD